MRQLLVCRACGAILTAPLTIHSTKDPATPKPVHRDGEPLTAPGTALKSWEPQQRAIGDKNVPRDPVPQNWISSAAGDRVPLDFVPQHWINPADLTKPVHDTKKRRRLSGCCGLAGSSGPNQVCTCGAEVGTLRTDCWTDNVFVPEPVATRWLDEIEDNGK